MAKAMNIVDVFKALLNGSYIVEKCNLVTGKSQYKVMLPAFENQPHKCAGHITEKQFSELRNKGVIIFAEQQRKRRKDDRHIYGVFYLNKEDI